MQPMNTSPKDKILDKFKLKDFADNKINKTQKLNCNMGRADNRKGDIFQGSKTLWEKEKMLLTIIFSNTVSYGFFSMSLKVMEWPVLT